MSDAERLDPESMTRAFREARRRGMDVEPAVLFHDLGRMRARIRAAFPAGALHAVAIKANPLVEVLRAAVACGAGLEAASLEEVKLSVAAGCPPDRIVFFEDGTTLITELGRWVQAGCGFAVSRVEYVKKDAAGRTAILHLGADFLLRRAYHPEDWHHDFVALDPDAAPKAGPLSPCTLGGPLCFGGDVLARDLLLPDLSPGDLVLIRDTGAYTLSMWSRHCSRGIPAVLGVDGDDLRVLRERERPEDVVAFWSRGRGQP
ncbi:uncharacterized protein SOCEGT47_062530 [Sorangium cellulosum]|uniref:Diaminopimelate decarboxylase n=1 Tax=Sorangium cellulosum TaxID=56 RepID=A0A4P2Q818_SORCE|nr:hypothetical protein [Sorangium cellulosum]AUX25704.1 uncharacterized protein SOCEGT47_062530 [Sorangium cellulosum]